MVPDLLQTIKKFSTPLLWALLIGVSGTAYYFYQQAAALAPNRAPLSQQEVASLVAKVGRLIVLPVGETPTVATVTDAEKLRDQAFFANAKSGDKVLIYTIARKAFLYDPMADKVIDVAPLSVGPAKATTTNGSL